MDILACACDSPGNIHAWFNRHLIRAVEEADVHLKVKIEPLEAVHEVHERLRDVRLEHPEQADELHLEYHQLRHKKQPKTRARGRGSCKVDAPSFGDIRKKLLSSHVHPYFTDTL